MGSIFEQVKVYVNMESLKVLVNLENVKNLLGELNKAALNDDEIKLYDSFFQGYEETKKGEGIL